MIDAISDQMDQRILHILQKPAIDFYVCSPQDNLYLLALFPRQVADRLRYNVGQIRKGKHQRQPGTIQQSVYTLAQGLPVRFRRTCNVGYPVLDRGQRRFIQIGKLNEASDPIGFTLAR